jgi:nucleotide-binding universal stress UspA family protein
VFTTVLVPLDGSALAARALAPARALAERTGAALVLFTAWWGDDELRAQERLDRYVEDLGFEGASAEVVHDALIAPAILARAGPETIVCMSTRGRGGLGEAVLGSVAEEVVRTSDRPVLLVGPNVEREAWASELWFTDGTLLCPVDGSERSISVVPVARRWSDFLGLSLRVVEVVPPPMGLQLRPEPDEGTRRARAAAEALAGLEGSPDWEVIEEQDAAKALVDHARRLPVTLFVMATRARRGFARVALGSVTMQVVHRSPVPVLVVPPRDADDTR